MIRLGALGDVLRTLPAVAALRALFPASHLAWLVEPASEEAVRLSGHVDETLVFPRGELVESLRRANALRLSGLLGGFVRRLRARRFDCVLDFHGIAKSGLFARLSGSPLRYGYDFGVAREGAAFFSNRRVPLRRPEVSRYERNAALVRAFASEAAIPTGPLLAAPPEARAWIEDALAEQGRPAASGFVLLHPGSSERARHKRYAASAWAAVARRLAATGVDVRVVGGPTPEEQALVEAIVRGAGSGVAAAPPTDRFDRLVALIERAGVFAACDSGPLHAATLCGVAVVQLVGPTDPVHNEPGPASPWRRLRVPLPCSPCRRGCADPACMRAIAPDRVAAAIAELAADAHSDGARTGRAS